MGKRIGKLAIKRKRTIVCFSDSKNPAKSLDFSIADVAIDFSTPNTAFENITHALNSGIPVISGTTAWLHKLQDVYDLCINKGGAFLYASNFSLGANIFFELNKKLAKLMKNKNYKNNIHEIHHTQKIDSPSGTAIKLAKQMNDILETHTQITCDRINDNAGTHQIIYSSSSKNRCAVVGVVRSSCLRNYRI